MNFITRALLLLLLAGSAWAADVTMPSPGKLVGMVASDEPGDWGVLAADLTPVEPRFFDGSKEAGWKVCVFEGPPGRYAIIKVPKGGGLKISTVILGAAGPVTPPPPPDPIDPPPPDRPLAGMRVLVIYESDTPLPRGRLDAMNSRQVREYLSRKAIKGPSGSPEFRILDDDSSLVNLSSQWQQLRAALPPQCPPHTEGYPIPQVAIGGSDGSVVFNGAYPPTDDEALALFQKYGGP